MDKLRQPYEDIQKYQKELLQIKEKIKGTRSGLLGVYGKNISKVRRSLGMTQEQLADLSGLSRTMITNIETQCGV